MNANVKVTGCDEGMMMREFVRGNRNKQENRRTGFAATAMLVSRIDFHFYPHTLDDLFPRRFGESENFEPADLRLPSMKRVYAWSTLPYLDINTK